MEEGKKEKRAEQTACAAGEAPATPPVQRKVVVVGCGQVGATAAFALMSSGVASQLVLIDRDPKHAEGQAMDLNHGLPFVQPVAVTAGDYPDCCSADVVVVAAGAAQKPGETRLDLTRRNARIFQEVIPRIAEHQPKIILVITNPVDVLTRVALELSHFPTGRVLGSGTTLDTARFRFLLSRHCHVDARNVHAYIVGEHGDSEVPLWSAATIGGEPLDDFCRECGRECSGTDLDTVFEQARGAAYAIIGSKGYTNFAIALAIVRIVGSILRNENSVLTVSTLVNDYYGISDVCLSVPAILGIEGVKRHIRLKLSEDEARRLRQSAETLKAAYEGLR